MRKLTVIVAAIVALIALSSSAAFGYFAFTDNSSTYKAQAKAGTLNAPSGFSANPSTSTSATLSWTAPSTPSPTAYALTQSTGTLGGSCTTLTATSSSCTATGLAPGIQYTWMLKAVDDNWNSTPVQTSTTLAKVTPTITGTASPPSVTVGGSVDDQATVSGGYYPTGTITWTLYSGTGCTGTVLFGTSSGGTVNGDSTYTSASYSPTASGTDTWGISYSGDTSNNPVSACGGSNQTLTVNKAAPTVSTVASVSITVGASVTDTATLAGGYTPTGTITYTLYGPSATANCTTEVGQVTSSVSSGNGTYTSPSITPTQAGTYWWITNYGGDINNTATTNGCGATNETSTVNKATVTLTTAATPGSVTVGGSVADQSVLGAGYNPTGTITWTLYTGSGCDGPVAFTTTTGGNVNGDNTYTSTSYTPAAVGTYTWAVAYSGNTNNNAITTICGGTGQTLTVNQASPTLAASGPTSANASTTITAASISATLTGGYQHTGTITFTVFGPQASAPTTCTTGGTPVGSAVTVSAGTNTYNPTAGYTLITAGNYWWYASYSGDSNNNTAASTCGSGMSETVVAKANPTLSVAAPSNGIAGTPIAASSVTATLAASSGSNDTNPITFTYFRQSSFPTNCTTGGTSIGTATPSGDGTYNSPGFTPTVAGSYWWYVSAPTDANNNAAASTCNSVSMTKTVVTAGAVSPARSTVSASPTSVTADGTTTSTITVTLLDANNNPVSGKSVTLGQGSGNSTISAASGASNTSGVVTFTVKDTKAEAVTYTATDTTDSVTVTQTATVTFTPGSASAAQSTLTPTSASITANGTSTQVLTVQAKDANGNNETAGGATVTITKSSGTGTIGSVTDNGNGTYTATVTSPTTTGSGVFVATLGGSQVKSGTASQTQATITYTPGPASSSSSAVSANPTSVPADGSTTSTITVTLTDANNNPVAGKTVTLAAGSGSSTITTVSGTTNSSGQATFTAKDSAAETVAYTAKDTTDNVTISQTATVTYTAVRVLEFSACSVSTGASATCPATGNATIVLKKANNGGSTWTGKITLTDGNGNPVVNTSGSTILITVTRLTSGATVTYSSGTALTIPNGSSQSTNSFTYSNVAVANGSGSDTVTGASTGWSSAVANLSW